MTHIISHRGLDPDRNTPYGESTLEAFFDHLERGFGIEFDVRFTKDNVPIALHDESLSRITNGTDTRNIRDCTYLDIQKNTHIATVETLLKKIGKTENCALSALHIKKSAQEEFFLDQLIALLKKYPTDKLILFDVSVQSAHYIKKSIPESKLYASVSHPHDIARFGKRVGNTLLSLTELLKHTDCFDGAWLDEWDLEDVNTTKKTLYNEETFTLLKKHGLKSVVVSPELHASSPALLGGECHPDGVTKEKALKRISDVLIFSPDAICTDYPDEIQTLSKKLQNGVYSN